MDKKIVVCNLSDNQQTHETVNIASSCPNCGITLVPHIVYASLVEDAEDDSNNKVYVLNYCSHCNKCFISCHYYDNDCDVYIFESSIQINHSQITLSENLKDLSPNFISIYDESMKAEAIGLTSICGMGYRKALEFLVKDYSISSYPEDSEKIPKMSLAQCIDNYIKDSRISTLAKASAWLGNDQTHYIQKHTAYGLQELKTFITALVTHIDAELAYEDAKKLLSS